MKLNNLYQFKCFDWDAFSQGKYYRCIDIAPWKDFETKAVLGKKITVVIVEDKTPYKPFKDGRPAPTNLYEKLDFKISKSDVQVSVGDVVEPVNAVAIAYSRQGEHMETQLSVKAEDIRVLQSKKGA